MDSSPLNNLPQETLHQIFCHLPVHQIAAAKCVCKTLHSALTSPAFLHLLRTQSHPLPLLALKPSHRHVSTHSTLHAFDPASNRWLKFSLSFLPTPASTLSPPPMAFSISGLPIPEMPPRKIPQKLSSCVTPLTGRFKTLPQLGSAWSRHGSVLAGSLSAVLVLTGIAVLYYSEDGSSTDCNFKPNFLYNWRKFSSNLPSKTRSPVLISDSMLTLCDFGSPWRSEWAMFKAKIVDVESMQWVRLEKREWGDIFDILKRPRLVKSGNDRKVYMVGGFKSSDAIQSACTTILILRLDLESLEWEEAGRMPAEMYRCFMESGKFKVFGGGTEELRNIHGIACSCMFFFPSTLLRRVA